MLSVLPLRNMGRLADIIVRVYRVNMHGMTVIFVAHMLLPGYAKAATMVDNSKPIFDAKHDLGYCLQGKIAKIHLP
jgi:hypothetical protein